MTAKERVQEELKELTERHKKLKVFMFENMDKLSAIEKELMYRQDAAMVMYIIILKERIKIWRDI